MKHYIFPTVADADAFIADLKAQNVIRPEVGTSNYRRASTINNGTTMNTGAAGTVEGGGTPEDAAAGAVKGTGVGAVVGATTAVAATAGVLGTAAATAATVATGGLALPFILGLTALGAGVGAAVGGAGGAAGVDETGNHYYDAQDNYYNDVETATNAGGRAVAVDDSVPADAVAAAAARHNGRLVA